MGLGRHMLHRQDIECRAFRSHQLHVRLYRDSQVCYVYIEDMKSPPPGFREDDFRAARWFTRGWCLQELIAPRSVEFYTADWRDIGSTFSLCSLIEDITAI